MKKPIGPCVTLTEAARLLGKEYPEVRQLARDHILTATRTAQGWMVSLEQVQNLASKKPA